MPNRTTISKPDKKARATRGAQIGVVIPASLVGFLAITLSLLLFGHLVTLVSSLSLEKFMARERWISSLCSRYGFRTLLASACAISAAASSSSRKPRAIALAAAALTAATYPA